MALHPSRHEGTILPIHKEAWRLVSEFCKRHRHCARPSQDPAQYNKVTPKDPGPDSDVVYCEVCGWGGCETVGGTIPCPGPNPKLKAAVAHLARTQVEDQDVDARGLAWPAVVPGPGEGSRTDDGCRGPYSITLTGRLQP